MCSGAVFGGCGRAAGWAGRHGAGRDPAAAGPPGPRKTRGNPGLSRSGGPGVKATGQGWCGRRGEQAGMAVPAEATAAAGRVDAPWSRPNNYLGCGERKSPHVWVELPLVRGHPGGRWDVVTPPSSSPALSAGRLHAGGVVGRDRHCRRADFAAASGSAVGEGNGSPPGLLEQSQANRSGRDRFRVGTQGVPCRLLVLYHHRGAVLGMGRVYFAVHGATVAV